MEGAKQVLFVDSADDERCEEACLDCLLTFDAQMAVQAGLLDRRAALAVLDAMLAGETPASAARVSSSPPETSQEPARRSNADRLARATRRRGK